MTYTKKLAIICKFLKDAKKYLKKMYTDSVVDVDIGAAANATRALWAKWK